MGGYGIDSGGKPLMKPQTPYFLISEAALLKNLNTVQNLKRLSGVKVVLALKCFSTWGVFDIIQPFLDGTTSSGRYEVRLGHETFGKETHAYSVGYSDEDITVANQFACKIIFNSLSQLQRYRSSVASNVSVAIRINPEISYSQQILADPACEYSRLGVRRSQLVDQDLSPIQGAMFHFNCENSNFDAYEKSISSIEQRFPDVLSQVDWVSLGGGVAFTDDDYPLEQFADRLRDFSERYDVQVYLEPGEAIVTGTTDLVVSVVDIVDNEKRIAIVDSATEAHRLDTLIYGEPAKIRCGNGAGDAGDHRYLIGSCSCLAGDIFGEAAFEQPLQVGDRLHITDSGGYTMVKLNWFNGLRMPSIYCQRVDGSLQCVNSFEYQDFKNALSANAVENA